MPGCKCEGCVASRRKRKESEGTWRGTKGKHYKKVGIIRKWGMVGISVITKWDMVGDYGEALKA